MTEVTKVKKTQPKKEAPLKQETPNVHNILVGATEPLLKAISTLSASLMLQQPHFAGQANQQGLIELSNIFYQFMIGNIKIEAKQPE